jgi:hypothetical protein
MSKGVGPWISIVSCEHLMKPSGIRPIAVGETLRRIAGRFVTRWHKDKIITALGPHQYAMQSNGTTKLVLAARNTLEKHPGFVMLAPDAKNAFNAQSRRQGIIQMCAAAMSIRV